MASYQVNWKRSAAKELKKIPPQIIPRIIDAVDALAADPYPQGVVKLTGADHTFRIRVGDYRVIYTIESEVLQVEIVRVRHRRDVYR
jgi:mRNA interferase RelE/StbE